MSLQVVKFVVDGHAEPAGSKRAIPLKVKGKYLHRPDGCPIVNLVDANPKAAPWKKFVARVAGNAYWSAPISGPVEFRMTVYVTRPQRHYRTGKFAHELRPDAPRHPAVKPDVLKLARAIEDALTGVVYVDDAQIVFEMLGKQYGDRERVEVAIVELCDLPLLV